MKISADIVTIMQADAIAAIAQVAIIVVLSIVAGTILTSLVFWKSPLCYIGVATGAGLSIFSRALFNDQTLLFIGSAALVLFLISIKGEWNLNRESTNSEMRGVVSSWVPVVVCLVAVFAVFHVIGSYFGVDPNQKDLIWILLIH